MEGIVAIICIVILCWAYAARIRQYDRRLLRQEIGASSRGAGYLYFWQAEDPGLIKIGRAKDYKQRLRTFQTALPYPIRVVSIVRVKNPVFAEKVVHDKFEEQHLKEKGGTEWFRATRPIMTYAHAVCDPHIIGQYQRL